MLQHSVIPSRYTFEPTRFSRFLIASVAKSRAQMAMRGTMTLSPEEERKIYEEVPVPSLAAYFFQQWKKLRSWFSKHKTVRWRFK
jgi:hypothetical protein